VLAVNAGNMLFNRETYKAGMVKAARLTAELIIEANEYIEYDAISIGGYDLSLGIDYLIEKTAKSRVPLLSANLYNRHGQRLFAPTALKEVGGYKVGIIGLTDSKVKLDKIPAGHKIVVADPIKEAQKLVPLLKKEGAQLIVVLTDMKGGSLRKLARKCPSIDIIIASDKRNNISLPLVVDNTYITHLDRGGKCTGHLEISPATDATQQTPPTTRGRFVNGRLLRNNFIQLRTDVPDHPVVGPMVLKQKVLISAAQLEKIADIAVDESGCGKKFMGVQSCRACHTDRYKSWTQTKHSRAFQELVKKDRQYDEGCIMCHSLAFECADGNISLVNVEKFNNVQCESCHGPGDLHVLSKGEQAMTPVPTISTCLKCHTPERSGEEGFEYRVSEICGKKN
jgi:hypothetical protein